jgi:hypothetical protein
MHYNTLIVNQRYFIYEMVAELRVGDEWWAEM